MLQHACPFQQQHRCRESYGCRSGSSGWLGLSLGLLVWGLSACGGGGKGDAAESAPQAARLSIKVTETSQSGVKVELEEPTPALTQANFRFGSGAAVLSAQTPDGGKTYVVHTKSAGLVPATVSGAQKVGGVTDNIHIINIAHMFDPAGFAVPDQPSTNTGIVSFHIRHTLLGHRLAGIIDPVQGKINFNNAPSRGLGDFQGEIILPLGATFQLTTNRTEITNTEMLTSTKLDYGSNAYSIEITAEDKQTKQNYSLNMLGYDPDKNPYGIYVVTDLDNIRKNLGGVYQLQQDIVLPPTPLNSNSSGICTEPFEEQLDYCWLGWQSIGLDSAHAFTGRLNGQGHAIKNLTFARSWLGEGIGYPHAGFGLFGYINGGTISNLGVEIAPSGLTMWARPADDTQRIHLGAIAGFLQSGTIKDSYSSGGLLDIKEAGGPVYVGGLVGAIDSGSQVTRSYSSNDISVKTESMSIRVGGLVGNNVGGYITNTYAMGNIMGNSKNGSVLAGGLVGQSNFLVGSSYAAGNVKVQGYTESKAGGLLAKAGQGAANLSNYHLARESTPSSVDAFSEPLRADQMRYERSYQPVASYNESACRVNTSCAWDFSQIWIINPKKNGGYPILRGVGEGR